jgi:hypothetical protein
VSFLKTVSGFRSLVFGKKNDEIRLTLRKHYEGGPTPAGHRRHQDLYGDLELFSKKHLFDGKE